MLPPIEHRIALELGVRPAQVNAALVGWLRDSVEDWWPAIGS